MLPGNLSGQTLYNFIGGRRSYNAARQRTALQRQWRILFYWRDNPHLRKADIARKFGVSRSTVTRDIQALKAMANRWPACPMCHGHGRIDTGPDAVTLIEVTGDIARLGP